MNLQKGGEQTNAAYARQRKQMKLKEKKAALKSKFDLGYNAEDEWQGIDCNNPSKEVVPPGQPGEPKEQQPQNENDEEIDESEDKLECFYKKWKWDDPESKTNPKKAILQKKRKLVFLSAMVNLCEDKKIFCNDKTVDGFPKEKDERCMDAKACPDKGPELTDIPKDFESYLKTILEVFDFSKYGKDKKAKLSGAKQRELMKKLREEIKKLETEYKQNCKPPDGSDPNCASYDRGEKTKGKTCNLKQDVVLYNKRLTRSKKGEVGEKGDEKESRNFGQRRIDTKRCFDEKETKIIMNYLKLKKKKNQYETNPLKKMGAKMDQIKDKLEDKVIALKERADKARQLRPSTIRAYEKKMAKSPELQNRVKEETWSRMGLKPPTDPKELKAFEKKYKKSFDTEKEKFLTQKDSSFVKNFMSGKKKRLAKEAKFKDRKTEQKALLETSAGVEHMAGEIYRKMDPTKKATIIKNKKKLFKNDTAVKKHIMEKYGHEFVGLKGPARIEAIQKKEQNFKNLMNDKTNTEKFFTEAMTKGDFKSTKSTGLSAEFAEASGSGAGWSRLSWNKKSKAAKKQKYSLRSMKKNGAIYKELKQKALQEEHEKVRKKDVKKIESEKLMADPEYLKLTTPKQREMYTKSQKTQQLIRDGIGENGKKGILLPKQKEDIETAAEKELRDKFFKEGERGAEESYINKELKNKGSVDEINKAVKTERDKYFEKLQGKLTSNNNKKTFKENPKDSMTPEEINELEQIETKATETAETKIKEDIKKEYKDMSAPKKEQWIKDTGKEAADKAIDLLKKNDADFNTTAVTDPKIKAEKEAEKAQKDEIKRNLNSFKAEEIQKKINSDYNLQIKQQNRIDNEIDKDRKDLAIKNKEEELERNLKSKFGITKNNPIENLSKEEKKEYEEQVLKNKTQAKEEGKRINSEQAAKNEELQRERNNITDRAEAKQEALREKAIRNLGIGKNRVGYGKYDLEVKDEDKEKVDTEMRRLSRGAKPRLRDIKFRRAWTKSTKKMEKEKYNEKVMKREKSRRHKESYIMEQEIKGKTKEDAEESYKKNHESGTQEDRDKQKFDEQKNKTKREIENAVKKAKNKYLEDKLNAKLETINDEEKDKFKELFAENPDSVLTDTDKEELEAITTKARNTKEEEFNTIPKTYNQFAQNKQDIFINEQIIKEGKTPEEAERLYKDQLKKTTQEKIMEGTFKENYENLDIKTQKNLQRAINLGPSGYKNFLNTLPNQSDRGLIEMAKLELNDAKKRSANGSYKKTRRGFQTSLAKKQKQMLLNSKKRNESKMEVMRQVKAKRNSNLKKLENSDKFKAMTKNEQEKERKNKTKEYTEKYSNELKKVTSKLYKNQALNMIESKDKRRSKLSRLGRFIPGSSKATKQMKAIARNSGASIDRRYFRKLRGKDSAKYYKKKIEKEEAFRNNLLEQTGDGKNETKKTKFYELYEKAKKNNGFFNKNSCIKVDNLSPETCDYLEGVSNTKTKKGHSKTKKNVKYRLKKKQKLRKYFDKALPFIKRECKESNNVKNSIQTLEDCVEDKRKDMEELNTKQTRYQKYGPGTSNYRTQKRDLKKKSVIGRELNKGTEINNTTISNLTQNIQKQKGKWKRAMNVVREPVKGQRSIKTRVIKRTKQKKEQKEKITNKLNESIETIINNMKSVFDKKYKKEKVIEISNNYLSGLIDEGGLKTKIKAILNYKIGGDNEESITSIIENIIYSKTESNETPLKKDIIGNNTYEQRGRDLIYNLKINGVTKEIIENVLYRSSYKEIGKKMGSWNPFRIGAKKDEKNCEYSTITGPDYNITPDKIRKINENTYADIYTIIYILKCVKI